MMEQINHTAYPFSLRSKSVAALRFIAQDAHEAMEAMPEGPKAGYYADEINYCGMELARRAKDKARFGLTDALDQAREVCGS